MNDARAVHHEGDVPGDGQQRGRGLGVNVAKADLSRVESHH